MREVYRIRTGAATELPLAISLWQSAQTARHGEPYTEPGMLEVFAQRILAEHARLLLLEEDAQVVGAAFCSPARSAAGSGDVVPGLAHISFVAIDPARWGRGLGRALMNALIAEIKCGPFDQAQLWVHPENTRALALYKSLGFTFSREQQEADGQTFHRFVLALDSGN